MEIWEVRGFEGGRIREGDVTAENCVVGRLVGSMAYEGGVGKWRRDDSMAFNSLRGGGLLMPRCLHMVRRSSGVIG